MSTRKKLNVELFATDPTGIVLNNDVAQIMVIDDNESMKVERIFITIGEHTYSINKCGEILDEIVL